MALLALGIDVSVSKGLDLVCMDENLTLIRTQRRATLSELAEVVDELTPAIVAVDSPPAWGTSGKSRLIERQLSSLGLHSFATPSAASGNSFYGWMKVGFSVFALLEKQGFQLFVGDGSAKGFAIEVFPHASAVVLRGSLPARGVPKRVWRRAVLAQHGIDEQRLTTLDQIDACLAAFTGMRALHGNVSWVGEPGTAVLALPASVLPARRFGRESEAAAGEVSRPSRSRLVADDSPNTCG